jgi:hypothetical protein
MNVKFFFILEDEVLYQMLPRNAKIVTVRNPISHGLVFSHYVISDNIM